MSKTSPALSRYGNEATRLLGLLIRQHRLERKMTAAELAQRAGVSRGLVQRAERGDPGCAIGAVFELAAIVGVPLFEADLPQLNAMRAATEKTLKLLPAAARRPTNRVDDDF